MNETYWAPNEPKNRNDERCAVMHKDYNKNYGLFDALRCTALRHGFICESEYHVMCWIYTNKLWYGSETILCVIKVLLYSWCISYTTNLSCKHKKQLFHCILLSIWCKCILPRWQFKMWGIFSSTMRGNTTAIGYEAKNDESTMEKVICPLEYLLLSIHSKYSLFLRPVHVFMPSFLHTLFRCSEISKLFNWYYNCAIYKDSNKNFNDR